MYLCVDNKRFSQMIYLCTDEFMLIMSCVVYDYHNVAVTKMQNAHTWLSVIIWSHYTVYVGATDTVI